MKKFSIFLVMLVFLLVFGLMLSSCDNGSTANTSPKTLVITMPATIGNYGASGFMIGLFPVGTTLNQALANTGIVAGADSSTPGWTLFGIDPASLNLPLYVFPYSGSRWTGNGTYDIYIAVAGGGGHYYKLSSVNFSTDITNVQLSSTNEVR